MATFEKSKGQSLSTLTINYLDDITTESAQKNIKLKFLGDFPETLSADFSTLNYKIIKADLLFYTKHPNAWHSAHLSANK